MNTQQVKDLAKHFGFDDCRIALAKHATHADRFLDWIKTGQHGDMSWMEKSPERRCDPREVLPGCKSIICLALNYFPGKTPSPHTPNYQIAKYSWNNDYHDLLWKKLKSFDAALAKHGSTQRYYVDTGPILERDFANDSGLGWNGKSTLQIHRNLGTYFFLSELLTTLELEPDPPANDHCGKCTRCLDACPTGALTAPHQLDARLCISYLTIESHGPIPIHLRHLIGNHLYGCDACLDACPWNKFAQISHEAWFHAREKIFNHQLRDFLNLNDLTFRELFAKSPIKRIKLPRFLRNVCVVLGNIGTLDDIPALKLAKIHENPLISEHADWAISEISRRLNPPTPPISPQKFP